MARFRGVGERMKARLRALGYVEPDGRLRIKEFCHEKGYLTENFFRDWLEDRRNPMKDIFRLAKDLETSPGHLMFGDRFEGPQAMVASAQVSPKKPRRRYGPGQVGRHPSSDDGGKEAICKVPRLAGWVPRAA